LRLFEPLSFLALFSTGCTLAFDLDDLRSPNSEGTGAQGGGAGDGGSGAGGSNGGGSTGGASTGGSAVVCGDGIKDDAEACDDGNDTPDDGCTNGCAIDCEEIDDAGMSQMLDAGSGHCYRLDKTGATWLQSEDACVAWGGHLTSITSGIEQARVVSYTQPVSTKSVWIGLNDLETDGTFVWVDGAPTSYTNWSSDEPNGGF